MKNSKKIMIIVVSVIVSVIALLAILLISFNIFDKLEREEEIQEENIVQPQETEEVVNQYETIEAIDMGYTIEKALENNDFIIDNKNQIYNENVLNEFINKFSTSGDANLRVSSETVDSLLSVLEIQSSGDEILVIQNNSQLSGDIIQNKYLKSDGYTIEKEIVTLVDGTKLESYYLIKTNSEEKIDLFAYVVYDLENEIQSSGDSEIEIISSGELLNEIQKSGELAE